MKLTSLELLGFKSFLNRTTFRFDEGVTCIVGPNGCGKSNIVDAVSWVLGERGTKSLRVKEMGDVIFHGSTAKKQVNMAEVTMGLTNDGGEYAVRRRIYRDGTNEYYINGTPGAPQGHSGFLPRHGHRPLFLCHYRTGEHRVLRPDAAAGTKGGR